MKIFKLSFLLFSLTMGAAPSSAQVFYEYPGAPVVPEVKPAVGSYIAVGDNLFRMGGYGRFNVTRYADMGLELLFDREHKKWMAGAGGDLKYGIVPVSVTLPFDLSLNAGLGFLSGNNKTVIQVPIGAVISRPLELRDGNELTPYGGVYVLIIHTSTDLDPLPSTSDTDTEVELRGGVNLNLSASADVLAALHLGNGTKFYIGLNWHL